MDERDLEYARQRGAPLTEAEWNACADGDAVSWAVVIHCRSWAVLARVMSSVLATRLTMYEQCGRGDTRPRLEPALSLVAALIDGADPDSIPLEAWAVEDDAREAGVEWGECWGAQPECWSVGVPASELVRFARKWTDPLSDPVPFDDLTETFAATADELRAAISWQALVAARAA
jgi:hypothetical protein